MCQQPTTVTPPVDLDELSLLVERCECLSSCLTIVMSGSRLPDGSEKERILYELNSVIEESAKRASRLVGALM